MGTLKLDKDNFAATIEAGGTVLIDFWAAWCGPCRAFGPIFEKASVAHPEITFGKVDTDAEQEIAGAFGIQSIPTLMVFRDQVLVFAEPGALPAAALERLIDEVQKLDMVEVKKKAQAAKATG